jgi:hypothetical protein
MEPGTDGDDGKKHDAMKKTEAGMELDEAVTKTRAGG